MRVPFIRFVASKLRLVQAPYLYGCMQRAAAPADPSAVSAMVIAPHPDDETFACGGVIAWKRRHAVPVSIIVLTDGGRSHPGADSKLLVGQRQAESIAAAGVLGVAIEDLHFLEGPDGGLGTLPNDRRRATIERLAGLLRRYQPAELYLPHRSDRHPDHEAAFALLSDAIAEAGVNPRVLQYPIWFIWWGPLTLLFHRGPLRGATRIDIRSVLDQKLLAIAAYRSQLGSMPRGFMKQFTHGSEIFFPVS